MKEAGILEMRLGFKTKAKLGMRTIKTAIAVTLAVTVAYIFNLNSPFFVAIAALITLQGNIVDSFRMGRDRILGTTIGAFIGMLFSYIAMGNPLVIGFGVLIIIFISNVINFQKTISISSVIFISIMLNTQLDNIFYYGINLLMDTLIGIIIAALVNIIIFPHFSRDVVLKASIDVFKKCEDAIKQMITHDPDFTLKDLEDEIEVLEREYPTYMKEEKNHLCKEGKINLHASRNIIIKLYHNILILGDMGNSKKINSENSDLLKKMYNIKVKHHDNLSDEDIVYNYHLKNALKLTVTLAKAFNTEYTSKCRTQA